jgi:hypothetical protein
LDQLESNCWIVDAWLFGLVTNQLQVCLLLARFPSDVCCLLSPNHCSTAAQSCHCVILPGLPIGQETGHFVKTGIQQETLFRKQFLALQASKSSPSSRKTYCHRSCMIYIYIFIHTYMYIYKYIYNMETIRPCAYLKLVFTTFNL